MTEGALPSWREGDAKRTIVDFVGRVTDPGDADFVPEGERTAVFDNDGTLWCEKPMPVQLDFLVRRFAEMAEADTSLRDTQPYKASYEGDLHWLGAAMVKHYQGDDADLKLLLAAVSASTDAMDVEEYQRRAVAFFADARHPTLDRPYTTCVYTPMVELLRYLEANGFQTFIASGGERDFMRPLAETVYGISRERVIGSGMGIEYRDGRLLYQPKIDVFDDGPAKPVRIWSRIGRRPTIAGGNSNGDLPMLRYAMAGTGPGLGLVVRHDDAEREFDDRGGADQVLDAGFTEIGVRADWEEVFAAQA